ncbi:uncharacterized protein LOC107787729 isoform X2 [Nicotiana tabacum]|nr:PREDICTED: uncharacterized protein LOC107787729 isoform X2 [Nicotiana tabacum]
MEEIADNCSNAMVKFDKNSHVWITASAIKYKTFKAAANMFDTHRTIVRHGGVRVAHPIGYTEFESQGILFVQSLNTLTNVFSKSDPLWNDQKGKRVHFEEKYTNKFGQILQGLKSIHKDNTYHGRLSKGYLYGEDGNILLYNLEEQEVLRPENYIDDYKGFCSLIKGVIDSNLYPRNLPPHVVLFFSIVNRKWPLHPFHPFFGAMPKRVLSSIRWLW